MVPDHMDVAEYRITYIAEAGGHIDGETNQVVNEDTAGTTVTAVPDEGHCFLKWSDGKTEPTRTDSNVTADITLTAIFEKLIYSVNYKTSGNGTISGETTQNIAYGESSTSVTAIPNEGYAFAYWSDGSTNPTRQETNVKTNIAVTAFFEKLKYRVVFLTDGNGTIRGGATQTVSYGEVSTVVTAEPNKGYRFVKWSDGITEPVRQETNVKADISITAIFEKLTYTVTYTVDGNGTISGELSQTVAYGENSATVTAIPNEGYKFVKWTDGVTNPKRQETNVKANITLTAIFEKVSDPIINTFTVSYTTDGNGIIEGETYQTIVSGENSTTVTAVPKTGYKFVKWSDGNTNPTRQETNVRVNISLKAIFEKASDKVTYTVTYSTDGNGIIDGEAIQTVEYGRWTSTVKAVPNEGYKFVQWSDGNTSLNRVDRVTEDLTVTAVFEELILKVTYLISGGYFLVDGEEFHASYTQYVNYGCDTTKKPKPILYNSGVDFTYKYVFLKWSDGVETEERQDFNVKENISVWAEFGIRLTYAVDGGKGGKIIGNCTQVLEEGSDAEKVTAVPDDGYVFDGWSDWSEQMLNPERQEKNVVKSTNYVAYFAPIVKTFKYDYGDIFGAPMKDKVVINRYNLKNLQFVLPELQGYEFCGWYTDKTYTTKLANVNGKLMLGYYTFNLETDTIYARWKSNDEEEILTYNILTLCVEELHVPELKMYVDEDLLVDVHFTTTAVLRKLWAMYSVKVAQYLNEWFEGRINFEVDTYFTTEVLNEDNLTWYPSSSSNKYYYRLNHTSISEISDLLSNDRYYRNVIAIYDFGSVYSAEMRFGSAGNGTRKYAHVFIDCKFSFHKDEVNIYVRQLEQEFDNENSSLWEKEVSVYLHEFCHTIQFKYDGSEICDFHKVSYGRTLLEEKYYLLGIAEVDNKIVGVPTTYWKEGGSFMF